MGGGGRSGGGEVTLFVVAYLVTGMLLLPRPSLSNVRLDRGTYCTQLMY